jgi:predicted nucleic acid-binding Zn ribbon protein
MAGHPLLRMPKAFLTLVAEHVGYKVAKGLKIIALHFCLSKILEMHLSLDV